MVAAGRPLVALGHWSPAKLTTPDNQRVVEQAALFEVTNQGRTRPVDLFRPQGQFFLQHAVVVPVAMVQLDEARPSFGQRRASRQFDANDPSPGWQP